MAILHYKVTSNDENINLNAEISAQSFILRRIIVKMVPLEQGSTSIITNAGTPPQPVSSVVTNTISASKNLGGVIINSSHFNGMEIISGQNSNVNDIIMAVNELESMTSTYYDMEMESETIPRAFNVKVKKFDNIEPAVFGTSAGDIVSIDIFFQFSSLYNYEGF